jgi:hypothetical protein
MSTTSISFILEIVSAVVLSIGSFLVGKFQQKLQHIRADDEERKRKDQELRELVEKNTIISCRQAIYSEVFDVDEKIDAYQTYRSLGGNHRTKAEMDRLVGMDIDAYIEHHCRKD